LGEHLLAERTLGQGLTDLGLAGRAITRWMNY